MPSHRRPFSTKAPSVAGRMAQLALTLAYSTPEKLAGLTVAELARRHNLKPAQVEGALRDAQGRAG